MTHLSFTPRSFDLPEVPGISKKTLDAHLKLYEGYVTHANLILEELEKRPAKEKAEAYALAELQRRFSFEFDGMRNHEYYFEALEGGAKGLPADSALSDAITKRWGGFDEYMSEFKALAATRGIGWAMLLYDPHTKSLLTQWVDEQHLGHLTGLSPVIALDMWEHSYLFDYTPAEKAQYVESYLSALNFETVARRYEEATRRES